MTDDEQGRRRRAVYRARHRGTKEMDWLLGRFADAMVEEMPAPALERFEHLLGLPDPEIYEMVFDPQVRPADGCADLIAALRGFHGLARE
jgi:antitoxin CptB